MAAPATRTVRTAALSTLAVAPVAAAVSAGFAGLAGALAALAGVALALAFFGVSVLVVVVTERVAPRMTLAAALGSYVIKVAALATVLVLPATTVTRCFAWAVVASAVVWQLAHVVAMVRAPLLYAEPVPQAKDPTDKGKAPAARVPAR